MRCKRGMPSCLPSVFVLIIGLCAAPLGSRPKTAIIRRERIQASNQYLNSTIENETNKNIHAEIFSTHP